MACCSFLLNMSQCTHDKEGLQSKKQSVSLLKGNFMERTLLKTWHQCDDKEIKWLIRAGPHCPTCVTSWWNRQILKKNLLSRDETYSLSFSYEFLRRSTNTTRFLAWRNTERSYQLMPWRLTILFCLFHLWLRATPTTKSSTVMRTVSIPVNFPGKHSSAVLRGGLRVARRARTESCWKACANVTGSIKLPLLLIGESVRPTCFRGVSISDISVTNHHQKNGWANSQLFLDWFQNVFTQFMQEKLTATGQEPKTILLLNNCPAHPHANLLVYADKKVTAIYLPPNVTSFTQLMDQGMLSLGCEVLSHSPWWCWSTLYQSSSEVTTNSCTLS